jgi:hypothetical protein
MVCPRRLVSQFLALVALVVGPARGEAPAGKPGVEATASSAIDRLPYQICAQVVLEPETRIDARGREQLLASWRDLVRRFVGAPWDLTIVGGDRAPEAVDLETAEPPALVGLAHDCDKLWLLRVGRSGASWTLAGRELDAATQRLGPVYRRPSRFAADLPRALLLLAKDIFRPSATIGESSGGGVTLVVRGASLRGAGALGQVAVAGSVFRPIRMVTMPDGSQRILDIPFTYLRVESLEGPVARCAIHSGLRDPLTRRIAQKNTLVALGSAPGPHPTRLRFLTLPDKAPAAGYLLTGRSLPDGLVRELGTTDREGRVVLAPEQADGLIAVRLLAGGFEPLVEFPMMPGESDQERTLPPFDPRSQTVALETRLEALRDRVIDLVAVRARLDARIKARLDGEDFDGADTALREFARLPHRESLADELKRLKEDAAAEQTRTKTAILTKTAQAQAAELEGMIARYLDDDAFKAYAEAVAKGRADAAKASSPAKARAKPPR